MPVGAASRGKPSRASKKLIGYQLYCEAPVASTILFGLSALFIKPFASRSARCCNIRMAFGCTGFAPAPPAGVVGEVRPRAKPSCNHSLVMGTHAPAAFRYWTRNHPSIKFQVFELAPQGDPVGAPAAQPASPCPDDAIAILVVPTPVTATAKPCGEVTQPPAVKSTSPARTPGRSGCRSA